MIMCARSLISRLSRLAPCASRSSSSPSSTLGSSTTPLPITQVVLGWRIPAGIRLNLKVRPSTTTVWPALLPPWLRITIWADSASRSTILPLPSSPHWPPRQMTTLTCEARSPSWVLVDSVDVVEGGLARVEEQVDAAHRAVAVLGDVQFGDRQVLALLVHPRAVQEHHDVGVLLDAARVPQVAELGTPVG